MPYSTQRHHMSGQKLHGTHARNLHTLGLQVGTTRFVYYCWFVEENSCVVIATSIADPAPRFAPQQLNLTCVRCLYWHCRWKHRDPRKRKERERT